ncbi:Golgi resident protein GCP60-like isoform X2 [Gigantopelta aegis]|uniref:Golgi resident protein GCP60-like isoform X2 n=1 Tax=Gigantopelta aegis TaxID=1735272 RepID=UPI001B8881D8|nr:Golgi resident protein GCP60-like isoform X2 [Gigantopelta aegis]
MAASDAVVNGLESLSVEDSSLKNTVDSKNDDEHLQRWGFTLEDLYKIALKFYKEKEGKALQISYKDKLKLVAYTKQVTYGKFRTDVSPDVGFLDVVGNDRRQAWQSLGDMSKESAMAELVKHLDSICPLFKPFVEAHKTERDEKIKREKEEAEKMRQEAEERQHKELEEQAKLQQEAERKRQMEQEMQIRTALNQQTAQQFKQYAEQQYPGNAQMQEELIHQLQEQHFQQYMQQIYQQQLLHQQQQMQQMQAMNSTAQSPQNIGHVVQNGPVGPVTLAGSPKRQRDDQGDGTTDDTGEEGEDDMPSIAAASMWTRKDLKEFKDSLRNDKDSVIKIGSGETVTVRVPTHEDGTCLFWEFATDYYDVGFGVYFEWTIAPSNTVSVHVSESSDEEEFEEEAEGTAETPTGKDDVERGKKLDNRPPTDEIIPVYRRDCHEEVYCGSHTYPGRGVYLLKFDNSYSLWRSKTLYYRVYYSR